MNAWEVSAGAGIAASLLGRELAIAGWVMNILLACVVLLIILFVASRWREHRRAATHAVLGTPPDTGDVGDSVRMLARWADDDAITQLERQLAEGEQDA